MCVPREANPHGGAEKAHAHLSSSRLAPCSCWPDVSLNQDWPVLTFQVLQASSFATKCLSGET